MAHTTGLPLYIGTKSKLSRKLHGTFFDWVANNTLFHQEKQLVANYSKWMKSKVTEMDMSKVAAMDEIRLLLHSRKSNIFCYW